jgi:hypothetical protein
MPRHSSDLASWAALTVEGGLISPAMLARLADIDSPLAERDAAGYGLRKGLTLRDETSLAFRVGQSHWRDFRRTDAPGIAATRRFVEGLLREAFGFSDLAAADFGLSVGARIPVTVVPPTDPLDRASACLLTDRRRSAASALQDHLNAQDDALWGLASNGLRLRLMRDNASLTRPAWIEADLERIFDDEDIASFGLLWLVIHRTRFGQTPAPAADCPLERWRDEGAKTGEAAREHLAAQVEEALRLLGSGFLTANPDLRAKVWSDPGARIDWFNQLLRLVYRLIFLMVAEDRALLHPKLTSRDATANEARDLYAQGYSLTHLRQQATRRAAWDRHHDRFEGLKIVFHALAKGEPRLALPALGGLFDPHVTPDLDRARLPNANLMEALWRLSWLELDRAMVPVNWRAMETEELGSVYESLLELQPQPDLDGHALTFATEASDKRGNQRKTTGSYYTPDSLVQALLDTALDPVLDRAEAAEDPAEALLSLTVIDPACGSGHFLLAAARRIATRVARHRAESGVPSAADYRHALRDTARRCIHGVDRNPMAVELTKVALWIETVDPGLPLGFFDAQIRCGDALLGVFDRKVLETGIPDEAYKPLTGDDKVTARSYLQANRDAKSGQGSLGLSGDLSRLPTAAPFARRAHAVRAMPETTPAEVRAREKAWRAIQEDTSYHLAEMACDTWIAAFLLPKTGGPPVSRGARLIPTTEDVWQALHGRPPFGNGAFTEAARAARAFHWPLEFPDIMAGSGDDSGGFDVVLGNPPWERIKLQEQEFFAARAPEIAGAPNAAARGRMIAALAQSDPGSPQRRLHDDFEAAKRLAEAQSAFVRVPEYEEMTKGRKVTRVFTGGRFPFTGTGDVNTYALFAELMSRVAGPQGRVGAIVPTGIATDATTAPFFAHLVGDQRLSSLVDFENRAKLFPAVDSRMKFALLTLGQQEPLARFAFFLTETGQLAEPERNFTLSPAEIAAINPNTRTAPVFRSRRDAELTAKIYRNAPVLIDESRGAEGNPWGVSFMAMFHMSNDSALFRTAAQLAEAGNLRDGTDWVAEGARPRQATLAVEGQAAGLLDLAGGSPRAPLRYVPLYEAKMIHQFDHRWAGYDAGGNTASDLTLAQKQDARTEPEPRYWVPLADTGPTEARIAGVETRLAARGWTRDWLMGWRDIARATDERTVIVSMIPRSAVGHTLPLMFPDAAPELWAGLLANLGALPLDFSARQAVGGTHLTYGYLKQFPLLPPSFYTAPRLAFITPRVLELTYTSHSLAAFARDLGHTGPPFAWDEDRRAHLRAELDAFYARAYGLDRDELRYILDPADVMGADYPSETFRVLKEKEIRLHGEYRTRRLVLAAWDRMEADGTFRGMEM